MASYEELSGLDSTGDALRAKITQACKIAAAVFVALPSPTDAQKTFVQDVMANANAVGAKVFPLVIAKNKGATIEQITGALDPAIQSNVDDIIAKILAI